MDKWDVTGWQAYEVTASDGAITTLFHLTQNAAKCHDRGGRGGMREGGRDGDRDLQEDDTTDEDGPEDGEGRERGGRRRGRGRESCQSILLNHGSMMDASSWSYPETQGVVLGEGDKPLPMGLLDLGYDVWLTNMRGTKYSRKHETLDSSDP